MKHVENDYHRQHLCINISWSLCYNPKIVSSSVVIVQWPLLIKLTLRDKWTTSDLNTRDSQNHWWSVSWSWLYLTDFRGQLELIATKQFQRSIGVDCIRTISEVNLCLSSFYIEMNLMENEIFWVICVAFICVYTCLLWAIPILIYTPTGRFMFNLSSYNGVC